MQKLVDLTNSAAAYWGGYLAADGCLTIRPNKFKRPYAGLTLSSKEAEPLHKLRDFLEDSNGSVVYRKQKPAVNPDPKHTTPLTWRDIWYYHINCSDYTDQLKILFGLVPNKSKIYAPGTCQTKDFWRGYIDGDGWITHTESRLVPRVGICGTKETVEAFIEHLKTNAVDCSIGIREKRPGFFIGETKNKASGFALLKYLYTNAPSEARLERKYLKAMEFLTHGKII
jgi:hypothetical protein